MNPDNPFAGQKADLASLYRDPAAPKDVTPADILHQQTTAELATAAATAGPNAPVAAPAPVAPPPADSTKAASPESASVLERFKPLGIASLDDLRGKTDAELRTLSGQAIAHELRQQSLSKSFARNSDGSWDFTRGPDGTRTGLDAMGKQLPPGWEQAEAAAAAAAAAPQDSGTAAPAPAAAPAAPRPAAPRPAAPPPAAPAPKPVPHGAERVTVPAKKPAAKKPAAKLRAVNTTVRRML